MSSISVAMRTVLFAMGAAIGCTPAPLDPGPWEATAPATLVTVADLAGGALRETSGVAASRRYPGILWSHNDSGHPAEIVATDTSGKILGAWTVPGATNVDWEDLALGPCPAGACLYIGDTGDNSERRSSITIYRVPEPDPRVPTAELPGADALRIRLPDQARDIEALHVDRDSAVWLVSKGRSGPIVLYQIPAAAWGRDSAEAIWIDSLPIYHHVPSRHMVTGSAVSPGGDRVVVRTYHDLFLFERSAGGGLLPTRPPNRCDLEGLEVQGEGVDWWDESTLVLTSEANVGVPARLRLVDCGWRPSGGDSAGVVP